MTDSSSQKFSIMDCLLEGTALIEASAGTGKTYSITGLYLRMLLETPGRINIEKILVVTYTKAAVGELRERIYRKLTEAREAFSAPDVYFKRMGKDSIIEKLLINSMKDETLVSRCRKVIEYSIRNFDEAAVFTIHGFCQRILTENAFESSAVFSSRLQTDIKDIQNDIINDYIRQKFYKANTDYLDVILGRYGTVPNISGMLNSVIREIENKPFLKVYQQHIKTDHVKLSSDVIAQLKKVLLAFDPEKTSSYFNDNKPSFNGKKLHPKTLTSHLEHIESLKNLQTVSANEIAEQHEIFRYFSESGLRAKLNKNCEFHETEFFSACEKLSLLLDDYNSSCTQMNYNFFLEFMNFYKTEIQKRKSHLQIRTYSDLLNEIYMALLGPNSKNFIRAVRQKYFAVMIDEFQDTDMLQLEIFNRIFNDRKSSNILFFIGDPKQSVYSFRGADISAYIKSRKYISRVYSLSDNYRSHEKIVSSVNSIFSRKFPFISEKINYTENSGISSDIDLIEDGKSVSGTSVIVFEKEGGYTSDSLENASVEYCSAEIAEILNKSHLDEINLHENGNSRRIAPSDIAVLVRTNRQCEIMKNGLAAYGINAVIKSEKNIFDTDEALQMYYILDSIAYPSDRNRCFTALTTPAFHFSINDFTVLENDENRLHEILLNFQEYNSLWENSGFMIMFKRLLKQNNIKINLSKKGNGLRRITNYMHIAELIHLREKTTGSGVSSLLSWYHEQVFSEDRETENTLRLDSDDAAVQICTIHKSKGLEYNIVFLPFLWKIQLSGKKQSLFTFHDDEDNSIISFDVNDRHNVQFVREVVSESIRLAYVALTRAKYRNYLVYGKLTGRSMSGSFQPVEYLFLDKIFSSPDDYINGLTGKQEEIDSTQITAAISEKVLQSGGSLSMLKNPEINASRIQEDKLQTTLSLRKNTRKIDDRWRITSYSYLSSGHENRYGHIQEKSSEPDIDTTIEVNLSDFPPGTRGGNCIHEIFENINFSDNSTFEQAISNALQKYAFSSDLACSVSDMVNNVVTRTVCDKFGDFTLSDICPGKFQSEVEFYFPAENISAQKLVEKIREAYPEFKSEIELGVNEISGFLKGYIDLLFTVNDRYYILDWKTNYLGPEISFYENKTILKAMNDHLYFLQYFIYASAVDRFLKSRIKDYCYEKNFGGIYYFFVRGITNRTAVQTGIFHDRPEYSFLSQFTSILSGEQS